MSSGRAIPKEKHRSKMKDVCKQIAANHPDLTVVDLTNCLSIQMKGQQYLNLLATSMENNTHVNKIILEKNDIKNHVVEPIVKILKSKNGLQTLNLAQNKLNHAFCSSIAEALTFNTTLTLLNLSGAEVVDSTLDAFFKAFEENTTLTKIIWTLHSRKSFQMTKLLTRNNTIARFKKSGRDYSHLLSGKKVRHPLEVLAFEKSATAPATPTGKDKLVSSLEKKHGNDAPWAKDKNVMKKDETTKLSETPGVAKESDVAKNDADKDKKPAQKSKKVRRKSAKKFSLGHKSGPKTSSRKSVRKKRLMPRDIIKQVAANDPSITKVVFDGNTLFKMKSVEYLKLLSEAMATNTVVTTLSMEECSISRGESISAIIKNSTTLQDINLGRNSLNNSAMAQIADALSYNKSIITMNLMGAKTNSTVLTHFLDMFEKNITLQKIKWRLDDRLSFRLSKALTRNREIARLKKVGRDFSDKLPSGLKLKSSEREKEEDVKSEEDQKSEESSDKNAAGELAEKKKDPKAATITGGEESKAAKADEAESEAARPEKVAEKVESPGNDGQKSVGKEEKKPDEKEAEPARKSSKKKGSKKKSGGNKIGGLVGKLNLDVGKLRPGSAPVAKKKKAEEPVLLPAGDMVATPSQDRAVVKPRKRRRTRRKANLGELVKDADSSELVEEEAEPVKASDSAGQEEEPVKAGDSAAQEEAAEPVKEADSSAQEAEQPEVVSPRKNTEGEVAATDI